MVRSFQFVFTILCIGGLVGCSFPASPVLNQPTITVERAYVTVSALLTATARSTSAGKITPIPAVKLSTTPQPQPSNTPIYTPTATQICNLAVAGRPIDVTMPDDTQVGPGESFVKTWRLVNSGSCTWTKEYAAVFFSGMNLAFQKEEGLRGEITPGQSLDLSVEMVAPMQGGLYQSNWKLKDGQGNLFGIGPGGNSPFWVRIVVVVEETSTQTAAPPTQTSTPAIHSYGNGMLSVGQSFDLDSAVRGPGKGDDLVLRLTDGQLEWVPTNGTQAVMFGPSRPALADCWQASVSQNPLTLGLEQEGQYICLRTDLGLPASINILQVDQAAHTVRFQFTVWSIP
jgi:hypothetical protein